MSKLSRTLLYAALLIALGAFVADWTRSKFWAIEDSPGILTLFVYQQLREPATVVFLGSSRTRNLVIPRLVEQQLEERFGEPMTVFNLGQRLSNLLGSAVLLRETVRSNGCPRAIVVELTPASLNVHADLTNRVLEEFASVRDFALIAPAVDSRERLSSVLRSVLRGQTRLLQRLFHRTDSAAWQRSVAAIGHWRGGRYSKPRAGVPIERFDNLSAEDREQALALGQARYRNQILARFELGRAMTGSLDLILQTAGRCRAELTFLRPPTHSSYLEVLRPHHEDALRGAVTRVKDHGAAFIDSNSTWPGLVDDSMFRDPIHLNRAGATALSQALAETILRP